MNPTFSLSAAVAALRLAAIATAATAAAANVFRMISSGLLTDGTRCPKCARRAHFGHLVPSVRSPELIMRKTLAAAAVAAVAIAASLSAATAADKLKVGFIYLGPIGDFGWTYQHEAARKALV